MQMLKPKIYARILSKKKTLDNLRPLPPQLVKKLWEQMQIEFTYNSNAIEGNTLSLRETQLVIQEGITVRGKSLREHLEARNHPDAINYVEKLAQKGTVIKQDDILNVHELLMRGIDNQNAGKYRTGLVRVTGATFIPPPADKIQSMISELLQNLSQNQDELRPIELAAFFHHKFVYIHPFLEGNGRTARLLMNVILMRSGHPFTVFLKVDRPKYLRALSEADNGNMIPFTNFVAHCVERSLDIYLLAFEKEAEILTLAEASKLTPYTQEYLSLLARKGSIGAFKLRRNWVITKKALNEYLKAHPRNTS
ncbi:MAG: Fic/DOC family protein [Candidatus Bathyarchaeota archaeon BA2]|nr:MAG: Fic/DOC family protein [Candidatus Bathyarchaeota archaeon BA2]